jgi:hypothetical protein
MINIDHIWTGEGALTYESSVKHKHKDGSDQKHRKSTYNFKIWGGGTHWLQE